MTINMYLIIITNDSGDVCGVQTCLTLADLIHQMNKIIDGYGVIGLKCIHDLSDFDNILAHGKTRFIPKDNCVIGARNVFIKRAQL